MGGWGWLTRGGKEDRQSKKKFAKERVLHPGEGKKQTFCLYLKKERKAPGKTIRTEIKGAHKGDCDGRLSLLCLEKREPKYFHYFKKGSLAPAAGKKLN